MKKRTFVWLMMSLLTGSMILCAQSVEETLKGVSDIAEGQRSGTVSQYMNLQRIPLPGGVWSINAMEQDEDGMVWLATNRGLYAYDGYTFYNHSRNEGADIQTEIYTLQGEESRIVLGTPKGLYDYNLKSEQLTRSKNTCQEVTALCTMAGTRWIGSRRGLFSDKGSESAQIIRTQVNTLAATERDSILWIGTDDGLLRYDAKVDTCSPVLFNFYKPQHRNKVTVLLSDTLKNRLWIGTRR